jgi:hypothetical protein
MARCCGSHAPGWDPYYLHGTCDGRGHDIQQEAGERCGACHRPDHENACRSLMLTAADTGHAELAECIHAVFGKHPEPGSVEFVAYDNHAFVNLGTAPISREDILSRWAARSMA